MSGPKSRPIGERNELLAPLRYMGIMPRLLNAALAGFFLLAWSSGCLLSGTSEAGATPGPSSSPVIDDAAPAKDAGTIEGRITSIDYHSGVMVVDAVGAGRRTYAVLVVPGTNIQGAKDFHTIADLKKGAHVQVLLSQHGSTLTAQIIRLL